MTGQGGEERGPLRVLHVVGGMRPGGVENWLLRAVRSIDRGLCAMDFLVHTSEPCEYDPELLRLGARIFPCAHTRRPWRYARDLRRVLRDRGPYDVVHSHVFLYSGYVLALARSSGVPARLAHFHTPLDAAPSSRPRAAYRALMMALVSSCATSVLANSRSTLRSFGRAAAGGGERDQVIYPLTREVRPAAGDAERRSTRRRYGLPLDEPLVIYLARFAPLKNHAQMVRIADGFRARGEKAHFVLAGSHGALLEHYREAAASRANVTLLAEFEDPLALLASADVFFFPSLKEGFGIVAHEAAAAGLPVVASDLPGLREAVAPACHAFLFPPGQDAAAVESLSRLLADEALRSQAAEASRAWAASMSPRDSIRRLLAVYGSVPVAVGHRRGSWLARAMAEDREADATGEDGRPEPTLAGGRH